MKLFIEAYSRFIQALGEEYYNLPIWGIVGFIYGILFYFSLISEPSLYIIITFFSFLVIINFKFYHNYIIDLVIKGLLCFTAGILVAAVKNTSIEAIAIKNRIKTTIIGEISSIKPKEYGWQIILTNIEIEDFKLNNTPKKIRFNLNNKSDQKLLLGDRIKVSLSLMPPPGPLIPGGYDFSKQAYFNEIGAIGYNTSSLIILDRGNNKSIIDQLQKFRRNIYENIIKNLGNQTGNFAAAIIVGETSGIELKTLNSMRRSGLAHILCVSGMHISLVAMIFFYSSRILLNFLNITAYKLNVKKIGAIVAIIGSSFYLILSGIQVAATRAFIMTTIYMISVFLELRSHSLRSVFFAAFIILFMWPEYLLHPSFILSFTAVISIISIAGIDLIDFDIKFRKKTIFLKIIYFFTQNIKSTLAASLATAPFILYFFHVNPNYSLFANLIAVPITTFLLMPSAIICLILMPLNLDYLAWWMLKFSIDSIISIATYIANLPFANWYFGHVEEKAIYYYSVAFLIFCIGKPKLKLIGAILLIISIIDILTVTKPDIIIDGHSANFAINIDNKLYFSSAKLGKFKSEYWASWFGQENIHYITDKKTEFTTKNGKKISFCSSNKCNCAADLIINLSRYYVRNCDNENSNNKVIISRKMLEELGTLLIYQKAQSFEIKYAAQKNRFKFE